MADYVITPANVKALGGSTVLWGTAGATIAAGDALYEDPADGKLKLCRCDAGATFTAANLKGIALAGASSGQPVSYASAGLVELHPSVAVGLTAAIVLVSTNAGELRPQTDLASGQFVTIAGFLDSTERRLNVVISRESTVSYAD